MSPESKVQAITWGERVFNDNIDIIFIFYALIFLLKVDSNPYLRKYYDKDPIWLYSAPNTPDNAGEVHSWRT